MSEEENERDFIKVCFNVVAGLEVKNESQAIAKEAILDEVENLTKENNQLKDVIEEVREYVEKHRYITDKVTDEDSLYYGQDITLYAFNDDNVMELLQILDKAKEMSNE